MKILRFKALQLKLGGVSRSSLYRWEKEETFPKRIVLGKNIVGWLEQEVDEWIEKRKFFEIRNG